MRPTAPLNYAISRAALVLAALCLVLAAYAGAARAGEAFLPVDQAFRPTVGSPAPDRIRVHWDITPGYYLYRHRLAFELIDPPPGVALDKARLPDGERHVDEFFGEVETYRDALNAVLPVNGATAGTTLTLAVSYQGCADHGLCYPPQTRAFDVDLGQGGGGNDTGTLAPASEQDRLAGVIAGASLGWVILTFLGLGLLLAFTPCMLPMIPILSGLVAGQGVRLSRGRALALSLTYVIAMALGYTAFGLAAGLLGNNLQALLQWPPVIIAFSLLFVLLGLSMFGLFDLAMPAPVRNRAYAASARQRTGTLGGTAVMGLLSALIVGPCVAPPLVGALLYIGQSGDAVLGGIALFALGIGMGLPLIAIGVLGGEVLPRAGAWMDAIRAAFGFVLFGVAVWLLSRIVPGPLALLLWAALLILAGVYLGAIEPLARPAGAGARLRKGGGLIAVLCGVVLLLGAAIGGSNPLRPLAPLRVGGAATEARTGLQFKRIKTVADLRLALARAAARDQPTMLDFYADWCISCKELERQVFSQRAVARELTGVQVLRADVTAMDGRDRALLDALNVIGPPTILFFGPDGEELTSYRLVGTLDRAAFIAHASDAFGSAS